MSNTWWGAQNREAYGPDHLTKRDAMADAARDGDWDTLLGLLEGYDNSQLVNAPRPGGSSGYAPLHQAAWNGAPVEVVQQLIGIGAWRTMRAPGGEVPGTPFAIALARGHHGLLEELYPPMVRPVREEVLARLEAGLHALVADRVPTLVEQWRLVSPQLGPLTEMDGEMVFPVPGYYGGFSFNLVVGGAVGRVPELAAQLSSRMDSGPGPRFRITVDGVTRWPDHEG